MIRRDRWFIAIVLAVALLGHGLAVTGHMLHWTLGDQFRAWGAIFGTGVLIGYALRSRK